MSVLVTGGAGYIGSHAVKMLVERGYDVVVIDNLSQGHRAAIHADASFYNVDIANTDVVVDILRHHDVSDVMHFAAFSYVGESVHDPLKYYSNNTGGTTKLLQALDGAAVKRFVFSSTCATYGEPDTLPISEETPQRPINPYGWSKLFVEQILRDKAAADEEFAFTALRYFNVAGSALDGSIGEDHNPETHIIPLVLETALGEREQITVFGTDYDTPDGTCIRDYIHVQDLCEAHILAMESQRRGPRYYNLGIGHGYSVKDVIESAKRVTGREIPIEYGQRRAGDPPTLFANADKIRNELGWEPKLTDLDTAVDSAWKWMQANPNGYSKTPAEIAINS
jgi:UDP-glucose 4-epimerase